MATKPLALPDTARFAGSFAWQDAQKHRLSTPPLSGKVLAALHAQGISTVADLQTHGAVCAFARLKAGGLTVTRSVLWQLAALCQGVTPPQLSPTDKAALQDALANLPPQQPAPPNEEAERLMLEALAQGKIAAEQGEIPIGAVVVYQGSIIAAAHNECIGRHFVGAHAEMLALQRAGQILGNYRLSECDLYVTVEPCVMCASALLQARIKRVIYGVPEPKTGGVVSRLDLAVRRDLNHHTAFFDGIRADECRQLMHDFFAYKR